MLGQSSPIWSKGGKIDKESLDRTFKTPRVSMDYAIVPLVTLEGGIDASATLGLRPIVEGTATKSGAHCSIGVSPRLVAAVNPEVKLTVGVPKLAEIAEGGVRASLEAIDARVPTTVNVALTQSPLALDLSFKSEVQATFLKGRLTGWYKLKDVCVMGYRLVEDGLGIATSGDIELWESDGFEYHATLADFKGPIAFEATSGVIDPMR